MSDQLEDFIRSNRSEFDIHEPSPAIWNAIEKDIKKGKKNFILRNIGIAASLLILISASYFFGLQNGGKNVSQDFFVSETDFNEFNEAEEYYQTAISYKLGEAKELGVETDVINDIQQLDEVYNELKEEMFATEYKDKEILINLMIKNYKTKIELLERIINKTKNQNNKISKDEIISI